MTAPVLAFEGVVVRYDETHHAALHVESFALAPGERVALLGLNGSGKTTMLAAAVGLVPHEGVIRVCGTTLGSRTAPAIRERVGFLFNVPEDQLLFPRVLDDAAFGLLRRGTAAADATARTRRMLEALGIGDLADAPVHHLSHGQKQRVALAGALVTDPPLLLLDEPSAGLDPTGRRALHRLLRGLGAAMLVATHDVDFAAGLCTRFVRLDHGTVAHDGPDAARAVEPWEEPETAPVP